jgi:subtilisin-like proprotein convertase family protein
VSDLLRHRVRAVATTAVLALTVGLGGGVPAPASAVTPSGLITFDSTGSIAIPDIGEADPYPATITVPTGSGVVGIGDFSVTLHGFSHTAPAHLTISLVSPTDTEVLLLCEQDLAGGAVLDGAEVTFSTDGSGEQTCAPDALTQFQFEDPAGDWSLFVLDGWDLDGGSIDGYSISFDQGAPIVNADPKDVRVDAGTDATFTASGVGNPIPSVQWQVSTDGGSTFVDIAGATTESYTVTKPTSAASLNQYRAVYTNDFESATTTAATLTVTSPAAPPTPAGPPASARRTPTLAVSGTTVVSGDRLSVSGVGQPGEEVTLDRSVAGGAYVAGTTFTADLTGRYAGTVRAVNTASYRTRGATGLVSNAVTVVARSRMTMGSDRVARRKYTLRGSVLPALTGQRVKLYSRKANGSYRLLASVPTKATGRWSFTHRYAATKTFVFKAVARATDRNAANARTLRVSVR